jgi:hypothetical protein
MKTRIHVNQHAIKRNTKKRQDGITNDDEPVLTVKSYKDNKKCNRVKFDSGEVVYSPDNPLPCGARVWVETDQPVQILE